MLRPALTIGKVPLFYFVVHFALLHALAVLTCYVRYGSAHWMVESPDLGKYPFTALPGWGYALPGVYPMCRWFVALKQQRTDAFLGYL